MNLGAALRAAPERQFARKQPTRSCRKTSSHSSSSILSMPVLNGLDPSRELEKIKPSVWTSCPLSTLILGMGYSVPACSLMDGKVSDPGLKGCEVHRVSEFAVPLVIPEAPSVLR
jgi:hypothetical protein